MPIWILAVLALAVGGCNRSAAPATAQQGVAFTPDSVRQAQLAAFRADAPEVTDLTGGTATQEALVARLMEALARRDTADLQAMAITRSEFGWLYYPTNPQAKPPYDLDPGLFWFMLNQHSAKGLGKALDLLGGKPLRYAGYTCDPKVSEEGENRVYGPCMVRIVQPAGDTTDARVFSLMLERHGQWKIVSYANKLD